VVLLAFPALTMIGAREHRLQARESAEIARDAAQPDPCASA
jgi:hypothetical protein